VPTQLVGICQATHYGLLDAGAPPVQFSSARLLHVSHIAKAAAAVTHSWALAYGWLLLHFALFFPSFTHFQFFFLYQQSRTAFW